MTCTITCRPSVNPTEVLASLTRAALTVDALGTQPATWQVAGVDPTMVRHLARHPGIQSVTLTLQPTAAVR